METKTKEKIKKVIAEPIKWQKKKKVKHIVEIKKYNEFRAVKAKQ